MTSASWLLIGRGIRKLVLQPSAPLMGLGMSLFFLLVYSAGLGGIGTLPEFKGAGYLAFLFPLTIVSLAMGSANGAGQTLHADMQSGYFKRIYLSPAPRWAFAAAPLVADAVATIVATAVLLGVGAIFGLPFTYGWLSVLGVLSLSLLWGLTLSGLAAGVMLRTGSSQGAQIVTTAVFPLLFLSPTFLPRELITAQWLLMASWANPVTYILEAIRYLLAGTVDPGYLAAGISILSLSSLGAVVFALSGAERVIR